ncbi:PDZ domain-containing protein [Aminithiophilus ramosus]|uniref:PDZ domain-containing protein n=2 Tax=Synergistales TaxID=649776 RepID=A0A9Q7EXV7_9BACT|nr:PDZ domain-containing protein [Aminithiophilus ramosus]QTX31361.1 PDZ domain-containing protein [Aminithiophilus ramosus]QVL35160.1 PDZ domain-containing protein [Synergistota bacterium]
MKRVLSIPTAAALFFLVTGTAFAANLFTTTIRGVPTAKVQDVILEVMTAQNFTIDEVDPYKVVVAKNFGDGFWVASQFCKVKFNLLEREGDVKLMVSQVDIIQGQIAVQRSVDHLIPFIREIRHRLDGTPPDRIANETVGGAATEPTAPAEKALGLRLGEKTAEGHVVIDGVEGDSMASEAGLAAGDVVLEVNGRSTKDFDVIGLRNYLENRAAQKSSVFLVYSRDGRSEMVTLKN